MKKLLLKMPGVRRVSIANRHSGQLRTLRDSGLFDAEWYVRHYGLTGLKDPAEHYLVYGGFAGLNPNPLFHSEWYLERYPDVRAAGINPLVHYVRHGAAGLKPNPIFDSKWYFDQYADVEASGINPLLHYLTAGAQEGRNPGPLFDAKWYAQRYLGGRADETNPLAHYLDSGAHCGNNPHPVFDSAWYVKTHMRTGQDPATALAYFLETGWARGDGPSPLFDREWYLQEYPDVAASGQDPLYHYVAHGRAEGRFASRSPHFFRSAAELRSFLSALVPALESTRVTVALPLGSSAEEVAVAADSISKSSSAVIYRSSIQSLVGVQECSYPGAPYVAKINNTLALAGTRYVISGDRIIHDEEHAFLSEEGAELKYHAARRLADEKLRLDMHLRQGAWVDKGINVMHEYSNNYFHFMAETLPRLLLAEEAGIDKDVPILLESGLHENMTALLDIVNDGRRPILILERGGAHHVREMYYPSDVSIVVDAYYGGPVARKSALDVGRIRHAASLCKDRFQVGDAPARRKIYACRRGNTRQLLNQAELEAKLVTLGFEIVAVDGMSVETQIRIFSEAEIIIAPTGAQLTNIIWCAPGTKVIALASDHPSHQLYLWELLGQVSGANVRIVLGPRAFVRDDKYSVHDDYYVDVEQILTAIN
ncbi:DUF563 domain-containing protein [Bordetella sp. N]|uniref:glycosyltransferase family 61 protein n=1 Tax=Bordetella sp. N TaxID=1746199 RepID=UPI0018D226F0|nr:glycosyltransferase family 61 protein [Bordetella sp. N]